MGRFLAPDNYVQDPFGTQNFNRYGYALNNPMVYVDPDGEFIELFGLLNLFANKKAGAVSNVFSWEGLKAFTTGAVISLLNPGESMAKLHASMVGVALGDIFYGSERASMNRHLLMGQFYYDNNDIMGNIIAGGLSRNQHEGLQNFAGLTFGAYQIATGKADRVDYFGGATFVTNESNGSDTNWGVSLGNVINMSIGGRVDEARFSDYVIKTPIYMHEYGHTFDSRYYGGFYLLGVGLPSLISVSKQKPVAGEPPGVSTHDFRWYEMSANRHAARYFSLYYGVDWSSRYKEGTIETYYPTRRR